LGFISKQKREIYARRIKGFWTDFSHNRIGFVGLIIVIFFVLLAVVGPYTTPYLPMSQKYRPPKVASSYAAPAWLKIIPLYRDWNPTIKFIKQPEDFQSPNVTGALELKEAGTLIFNSTGESGVATFFLGKFNYDYAPPPEADLVFRGRIEFKGNLIFKASIILVNYTAIPEWEEYLKNPNQAPMPMLELRTAELRTNVTTLDKQTPVGIKQIVQALFGWKNETIFEPVEILFAGRGDYGVYLKLGFQCVGSEAYAELSIREAGIIIWGRVHGLLGTNFHGLDLWTELVYGARISLAVGLLAALLGTTLGIIYGVVAGYIGGIVDELLMRVVDVLLCLPVLPILLVLARLYQMNVWFIVVLIAIFGWQGLSRVIRSRVLSLKEAAFIESAKASGASSSYLIFRHLIPNVVPIASAALILSIPGAIITEAALSFLGFGDPNASTWGRMMYYARELGGFSRGAWWEWLPPGLCITFLCVGFVFIGHAVDEVVNPRLRRRR